MKRILALSVLTLAVLGGVASADRRGHGRGNHHKHHRDHGRHGGVVVRVAPVRVIAPRIVVRPRVHRRPIYVQRPAIAVRYYDYDRRPTVVAENHAPVAGYYWVDGAWSWTGYEWTWTAGHYEPDSNYSEPGYSEPNYDTQYETSYHQTTYYDGY